MEAMVIPVFMASATRRLASAMGEFVFIFLQLSP